VTRGVVAAAAAAVFAAFAGMFGAFPILTPYALQLGGTEAAAADAVSAYSIANLPGNLVAGFLIDRWGPLAVLRVGLGLVTGSIVLYTLIDSIPALVVFRGVHGFAAGWIVPAAFALAAAWLPAERRGRGMGQMGAPIGLSAVLLPPLTGILGSRLGPRAAFAVLAAVIALMMLLVEVLCRTGPSRPAAGAAAAAVERDGAVRPQEEARPRGSALRELLTDRRMLPVWLGGFVLPFNLGVLAWYLPLAGERLAFGGSAAGGAGLGVMALVAAAMMMGPGGRWTDRPGLPPALAVAGMVLIGLGMALWAGPSAGTFYGAAVVFGAGFGLVFPASNALLADVAAPETRGLAFALFYAWFSVGTAVGPPLLARWQELTGQTPFIPGAVVALALAAAAAPAVRRRGGMP